MAGVNSGAAIIFGGGRENKETDMTHVMQKTWVRWFGAFLGALLVCAGSAGARDIGGTISSTLTIIEDSQLVDDVACTVTGAVCIAIGAPNVKLELNGFTMTGQADPQTGCRGLSTANEVGIEVNAQSNAAIVGPGLVQRFRSHGVRVFNSTGMKVTGVTMSTNCLSGIIVQGGSLNEVESNTAISNGNLGAPCGGI
jgi:hypothetical protein